MFEAELFASGGEGVRGIARPIIGHDPFDGDAEASVAGQGGFQMGDGAVLFLVGEHAYRDVSLHGCRRRPLVPDMALPPASMQACP